MRYYRIHTADIAYITQQPRGIFTAIGKLVDAGILSLGETAEYRKNRTYFEKALQVFLSQHIKYRSILLENFYFRPEHCFHGQH